MLLHNKMQSRYEFRVWGDNLQPLKTRFEQRNLPNTTKGKEIYLLSLLTDRCNAKIRNRALEIKLLLGIHQRLEQWQPALRSIFPVSRSIISEQFFPCLEVETSQLFREQYDVQEFLDEVITTRPEIEMIEVSKTRSRFKLEACTVEFTIVSFDHTVRHTVAIESVDAQQMLRLIAESGLQGAENVSYVQYLKRFVQR